MPLKDVRSTPRLPTREEALRVWLRIGCLSFGGPAAQIALMHREVVDDRLWVSDRRFLQALNFCTLLPGPEAMQLATYLGWLLHGVAGGIAAGLLFVLPGAAVMLALSLVYAGFGTLPTVAAAFFGLKCAVLVLVAQAVQRLARRALKSPAAWAVAVAAFVALFGFAAPFPLVVLAAALVGVAFRDTFAGAAAGGGATRPEAALDAALAADPGRPARMARQARRAGLVMLVVWLVPVALLWAHGGLLGDVALFFSKLAVVTFGGAYAVLAYAAQGAVQTYGWLTPGQMLDGLGLAETTPGPLILVLQHVGFMAGFGAGGVTLGILAALVVLWATFAPCFAWVFLGAPFIERMQDNRALSGALSGVTASVVGVIANLALWFALHVLFRETVPLRAWGLHVDAPVPATLDLAALLLAVAAGIALLRFRLGVLTVLSGCAAAGLLLHLAGTV
jgi:chromate transporter